MNSAHLERLAYRFLVSVADAEEIVQEAHLRLHARGSEPKNPEAYLVWVVANLSIFTTVAATPSIAVVQDGKLHSLIQIEPKNNAVHRIYVIRNPHKLKAVAAWMDSSERNTSI